MVGYWGEGMDVAKWGISKDIIDTVSCIKSCLGTAFQPTDNSIISAAILQPKEK